MPAHPLAGDRHCCGDDGSSDGDVHDWARHRDDHHRRDDHQGHLDRGTRQDHRRRRDRHHHQGDWAGRYGIHRRHHHRDGYYRHRELDGPFRHRAAEELACRFDPEGVQGAAEWACRRESSVCSGLRELRFGWSQRRQLRQQRPQRSQGLPQTARPQLVPQPQRMQLEQLRLQERHPALPFE